MKSQVVILVSLLCFWKYGVNGLSFPGPRVYVVTPSARPFKTADTPFYYHNWKRRMDTGPNITTTTAKTTTTPVSKVKTPDLIFAEFDSDAGKQKSIRKLLEKERIIPKKTTMKPIYIPDEEDNRVTRVVNYGLPVKTNNQNETSTENIKYPFTSEDDYYNNVPAPVYIPAPSSTVSPITTKSSTPKTNTQSPLNIENVWHIIDSEKSGTNSGKWEEISFGSKDENNVETKETENNLKYESGVTTQVDDTGSKQYIDGDNYEDDVTINENFALPGFATNPGSGAENESRAIRTEQNIRFPYINLKPFQVKPSKKGQFDSKKINAYTTLDNFYALKNPVRGEAQDIVPLPPSVDRYNPAQPYLPQQPYGSKLSKQSSSNSLPSKATANLVPPPPMPPKFTGDDFPAPVSYESFPPYAPSTPDISSAPSPPPLPQSSVSLSIKPSQPIDISDDSDNLGSSGSDNGPDMDKGYRYKPPSVVDASDSGPPIMSTGYEYKPPADIIPQYYPKPVPPTVPFKGYSYNKPTMSDDTPPMKVAEKPAFNGYHYDKPTSKAPYDMPPSYGYPSFDDDSHGHDHDHHDDHDHDHFPIHFYSHDESPPHSPESDYPNLSYGDKPHGDVKDEDDMKEMGMAPPAPMDDTMSDMHGPPSDDHGFPSDFKFHDFDEHEHYHYHTTTTTTEMPRVNRFSYYYLGKKLYYLPLYFSVYFIIYVGALIIKAVLRHKIVYPNSWRPNTTTAAFFSKRSVDEYLSHDNINNLTRKVTHAIATAAEKYMDQKRKMDKK